MAHRVLLLDDEHSVRRSFRLLLEEEGYRVHTAESVDEALEALEQEPGFDAAIIDIVMAGEGGQRFLSRVRRFHRDVAVVAITGDPSVFMDLCDNDQLDACLVKPVTRDVLLEALTHAQTRRLSSNSHTRIKRPAALDDSAQG